MGLFDQAQIDKINQIASKSKKLTEVSKSSMSSKNMNSDLAEMSKNVVEYFADSDAILIDSIEDLHDYVTKAIESGYAGIDTETTGLDRIKDTIVGASLYYPGGVECYIPIKHLIPIFDEPYKNQLSYEQVGSEFQRLADSNIKLIFANADFDLSMIYKDLKVDLCDVCYYDVILAWRCLKEDEKDNALKVLYNKYVMKGSGDPMKFRDFFTPQLFPYCKPEVAKLYAANDAKITFELFKWQLPYITKTHKKCIKNKLEGVADLIWNVEFPMIKVCQKMHRLGIYIDMSTATVLRQRYADNRRREYEKLSAMVDDVMKDSPNVPFGQKRPFTSGKDFNQNSPVHVKYLLYTLMNVPKGEHGDSTDKHALGEMNLPITKQILKVRSLDVLINTFVDKLPNAVTPDSRIHAQFKQVGADTGRMSSQSPNLQNIPSHAIDIRHMFRATPGYVMLSSDYSAQEPRILAFVSQDPELIKAFKEDRDVYASIASLAFNVPYEKCLEFHPETHEYQPEGKARRSEAKTILLGIMYGRSIPSIAEQLYGTRTDMTDEEKTKGAQKVYDSVMKSFPGIARIMKSSEAFVKRYGYTETILGRRRHLPDMRLKEFEFVPAQGYVNPDIDPLDPSTFTNSSDVPDRIQEELYKEFKGYRYFGQIARRTRELYEDEHIRVINNRPKINDARRQVLNGIIQGSAADQTKLAMLKLENSEEWKAIGGRLLIPVHDELLCEVPIEHWEEGGRILSEKMCEAADFLPFPSKCDVTTTLRWYGLEYPCRYTKPTSIHTDVSDEIRWIQYHLFECEYELPVFNDENGDKPRGDAALGVNGTPSEEYRYAIRNYMQKYHIDTEDKFLDDIERRVIYGM